MATDYFSSVLVHLLCVHFTMKIHDNGSKLLQVSRLLPETEPQPFPHICTPSAIDPVWQLSNKLVCLVIGAEA